MKKGFLYFFTGCMALLLAGCGGKDGGGNTASSSSKEYVYKAEEIEIEELGHDVHLRDFYVKDGKMHYTTQQWQDEGVLITVTSRELDGSGIQSFALDVKPDSYVAHLDSDEQGNFYMIYEEYIEEESDTGDYTFRDDYYLVKLDNKGNEVWRQFLNENKQDYWVNWMKILSDGRIAAADQEEIVFYDGNGNVSGCVRLAEGADSNIYFLQDETAVANVYDEKQNKSILRKLDLDTGELSGEYEIPGGMGSYSLYPGAGCDFMLVGSGGIYSYNLGDEEVKKLMDFIDSDLDVSYLYDLWAVSEKEFYGTLNDDATGNEVVMKFTKVDPKDVADRTVLTLACNYLDWRVRRYVVEFNKANTDYRVKIEDYSQYNTEEDYTVGITRLNTDIVSGKMPDILLLNDNLPTESYAAKGLFEDLYPYMDKDGEIRRENFFPNVLKAYETNGKLYRLVPSFAIYTVVGKTSDLGGRTGWTLEEFNDLMASKPEGTEAFPEATRNSMLYYSIQMTGNEFIDWESGKCSFDSEGFISLLEFLKGFPEMLPEDYYEDPAKGNWDTWFRDGTVLLDRMTLDSFYTYNYTKKGTFGEDITLIGFPCESGQGSAMFADLELAMSSKSKNKEGAWIFLRHFLTDEYQKDVYGWPLSMKHMDDLAEKAKKRPSYEDEDGNLVEYDDTYYIGDVEIPITPMAQEEIDEVTGFIRSVEQRYSSSPELVNIITEEAAPYFAGQKNVHEVADIIQNRVQIYVSENR